MTPLNGSKGDRRRLRSRDLLAIARSHQRDPSRGRERGVLYTDVAQVARVGADGLRFTLDSHFRFAELVATTVSQALPVSVAP